MRALKMQLYSSGLLYRVSPKYAEAATMRQFGQSPGLMRRQPQ